ncbi:hypothetical protein BDW22DRAFT_730994 [Trametopsis cervina]|nr:hypothetical protein BDW22DRAFT_730994 [Trametopsis cervina]
MAGDHKCPVCSSTFTRPQHVARHMRSHTGDRPYKCQHCGDQFARSDLLSRHINKCHAAEKPPTTTVPNNRRKGTAAASRATTSKQACDQCVTSSLPCDGSNPCTKCIQRKCRCTYVKFHRQTAPAGPGHPPPNSLPQQQNRTSISLGGRVPDEFLLGPAPTNAMGGVVPAMYLPQDYPLPSSSMYPTGPYDPRQSPTPSLSIPAPRESIETSPDMMARYRAQAALLSRASALQNGGLNAPGLADSGLYADPSQLARFSGGMAVDEYGRPFPGGGGSAALAHPQSHGGASGFPNLASQSEHSYGHGAGGGIPFPQSHSGSSPPNLSRDGHGHHRRSEELSDEFGSDGHSLPSSANSSSVSLPIEQQHGSGRMYDASGYPTHHGQRKEDVGEGGFSSAFGLMSLDDPAVLAGLANDSAPFFSALQAAHFAATDHSATHHSNSSNTSLHSMTSGETSSHTSVSSAASNQHEASGSHGTSGLSLPTPTPDLIASLKNGGILSAGGRDILDSKELREFWKQYMRTPLTGPGGGNTPLFPLQTPTGPGQQLGSTSPNSRPSPTRRHSRVASLPSMKTPPIFGNYAHLGGGGAIADMNSFAPSGNFSLNFQPKMKNRTQSQSQPREPQQHDQDGPAQKLQYSSVRTTLHGDSDDLKSYEQAVLARKAPTTLNLVPRRRGTLPPGSSVSGKGGIDGFGSLSQTTNSHPVFTGGNKIGDILNRGDSGSDRPGSSSNSLAEAFGAAHGFQPQQQGVYHSQSSESPPGQRESSVGAESDSGLSSSSPSQSYRPSFKRLASQTLGPTNNKRALLGPAGWDDHREESEEAFDEDEEDERHGQRFTYEAGHPARRFSLPMPHSNTSGGAAGGLSLPPIRTASEQAEAHA